MRFAAPAKLNLMLNITGRREDGYHELQTVFQFIDLCDWIDFELRPDADIRRLSGNEAVDPQQDLCLRAARLLQRRGGIRRGADIRIDKRIPMGGGLGGGSSDAACSLLVLNRLWELDLPLQELCEMGLELGADVPIFVHGRAAWAEGVGERFEAVDLPQRHFVVIDPKTPVDTADVFNARELTRNGDPITIRAFLRGAGGNLCEPVVRNMYPAVAAALDWLGQHAKAAMSGTGACVFAGFDSLTQAKQVKSRVPEQWDAFLVESRNRSPLHQQLESLVK